MRSCVIPSGCVIFSSKALLLNVVVFKVKLIRVKWIWRVKNYPLKGRNFVIFFVDKPCYKHLYLVYANRKLFHFHFFLSLKLIKARIKSFNNLSLPVVFRGALGGISLFFLTSQEITHEFVRKKRFHKRASMDKRQSVTRISFQWHIE